MRKQFICKMSVFMLVVMLSSSIETGSPVLAGEDSKKAPKVTENVTDEKGDADIGTTVKPENRELSEAYFSYEDNGDNAVTITGFSEKGEDAYQKKQFRNLILPKEIDGKAVTAIEEYAFSNCENLISVELPDTVTSVGDYAFYLCKSITQASLGTSLESIGVGSFYMTELKKISLPDTVISIGSAAFWGSRITEFTIPRQVEELHEQFFEGMSCLERVRVAEGNTAFEAEKGVLYTAEKGKILCIPRKCRLTSFVVKEGVEMADNLFRNCENLRKLEIYTDLSGYDLRELRTCSNLRTLILKEDNGYYQVQNGVVYNADMSELLFSLPQVRNIVIPATVETINVGWIVDEYGDIWGRGDVFTGAPNLASIAVDEENPYYCAENGILYDKDMTILLGCPQKKKITNFVVPETVTQIEMDAFYGNDSLKSVDMSNSESISLGAYAFYGCTSLSDIKWPANLEMIPRFSFSGCSSLKNVVIPESVTEVDSWAFTECDGLESITIPDGVETVGNYAFRGCTRLNKVYILGTDTVLGKNTFFGIVSKVVLYGQEGSAAEEYAKENDIRFEVIK